MAREVVISKRGRVSGVIYIDKRSGLEHKIESKSVMLAASACESARLLLNSKSKLFPNGLANSSGWVGRGLMDSVGSSGLGYLPQLRNISPHNHDGVGGGHIYIPSCKSKPHNSFPRSYHIEISDRRVMPAVGMFDWTCEHQQGYGLSLKQSCRDSYGTIVVLAGRGEMVPNEHSYCEIDPDRVDQWGIPVLRFSFRWSDSETKMARDMQETFRSIVEAAGGVYLTEYDIDGPHPFGLSVGGGIIHEVGTVRMGAKPSTSVLNRFCQAHEVPNLFVIDGGSFVSNSDKNPTLTIMALAWQACEYFLEEAKRGNL